MKTLANLLTTHPVTETPLSWVVPAQSKPLTLPGQRVSLAQPWTSTTAMQTTKLTPPTPHLFVPHLPPSPWLFGSDATAIPATTPGWREKITIPPRVTPVTHSGNKALYMANWRP